jgi:hypothetical protein
MDANQGKPIWSILSEDLVTDLLTQIPLVNGGNVPESFLQLAQILREHPSINTLHTAESMDVDESPLSANQTTQAEERSTRNLRKKPRQAINDLTRHIGEPGPAHKTSKKRPRPASGGACCRNGLTVSLKGSTNEERQIPASGDADSETNENDTETDAAAVWRSDGVPPVPEDIAKYLFSQLATIDSTSHAEALTTLLHGILSDRESHESLSTYDLSFSSLIAQCNQAGTGKAIRAFRTAILYIRLAIHIDL